jgi:hypothetical protein
MEVTGNYWIASFGNGLASGRVHRQRGEPCGIAHFFAKAQLQRAKLEHRGAEDARGVFLVLRFQE